MLRNGREYLPGDEVDMTISREYGADQDLRHHAAHVEELKASGAIKEA
jgi:hypothetical protein